MNRFILPLCVVAMLALPASLAAQPSPVRIGDDEPALSAPDSVTVLDGDSPFNAVAFSPDGKLLAGADVRTVHFWDPASGGEAPYIAQGEELRSIDFDPHGGRVVYACFRMSSLSRGYAFLHDLASGDARPLGPAVPAPCIDATFSPDGHRIVTTHGASAIVWEAATGDSLLVLKGNDVSLARFTPDGKHIATSGGDTLLRIWDAATGDSVGGFPLLKTHPNSIRYSPDGSRILTASDSAARVWDVATGALLLTLPHADIVTHAEYAGDGSAIITSGYDRVARIWDAATGALRRTLLGHVAEVLSATFSPDGILAATAGADGSVRIWRLRGSSAAVERENVADGSRLACFPNPARDRVQIDYEIERGGPIRVSLIDMMGREVAAMADGLSAPGRYSLVLPVRMLPAGLYFCVLRGAGRAVHPITIQQ